MIGYRGGGLGRELLFVSLTAAAEALPAAAITSLMGMGGRNTDDQATESQAAENAPSGSTEKEARFMAALSRMMGDTELTEENIRDAMQKLTPEQRQELLSEGAELKEELLTKQEHAEDAKLYFKEVNQCAEQAGMPADKDGTFLVKKVCKASAATEKDGVSSADVAR